MDKPKYKVLRVDLTEEKVTTEEYAEKPARKFLGGAGFSAKTIWDETNAGTGPFSEENPLIFSVGPATGTTVPSSSRLVVAGISPQTNIWGEAHAGGSFAASFRRTGYLALVIKGKARRPVYLWVQDGKAKIVDASHLWGKDTFETHDLLLNETNKKGSVAAIGPAGENLVRIASIVTDGPGAHLAARCGLGALMGFKNVKAVVASGTGRSEIYDEKGLRESINRIYPKLRKLEPGEQPPYAKNRYRFVDERAPIKNFQLGEFEGFKEAMVNLRPKYAAAAADYPPCPHCRNACIIVATKDGVRLNHGECTMPMGSNCLIDNFGALDKAFEMCNRAGIDTISAGDIIAFAMELYDKGIVTQKDTDGIQLTWGNAEALLQILRKIINAEGFGHILGLGVKQAAAEIGGLASEYALHVKGLEFSLHDPRSWNHYALQNATANRGADHMDGFVGLYEQGLLPGGQPPGYGGTHLDDEKARKAYDDPLAVEGMGKLVAWSQNFSNFLDSFVTCLFIGSPILWIQQPIERFPGVQPEHIAEWLHYLTAWDVSPEEIMRIGERVFNLKRLVNVRRGISRKDDTLPPRMLTRPRGGRGPAANNLPHLGKMLNEYYNYRGWSEEGIPTKEKLRQLELGLMSEDIL